MLGDLYGDECPSHDVLSGLAERGREGSGGWLNEVDGVKLICRKCGLECPATSFEDVERIQRMTCGAGGTHRLVGVK